MKELLMKEILFCAGGVVVGAAICYGGYRLYLYKIIELSKLWGCCEIAQKKKRVEALKNSANGSLF